jgi:hypothetical protein
MMLAKKNNRKTQSLMTIYGSGYFSNSMSRFACISAPTQKQKSFIMTKALCSKVLKCD